MKLQKMSSYFMKLKKELAKKVTSLRSSDQAIQAM